MRIWRCSSEVRIYNPQEKKLDPMTISGYFIGYAERSKWYRSIFHLTILGLWNQKMLSFLRMTWLVGAVKPGTKFLSMTFGTSTFYLEWQICHSSQHSSSTNKCWTTNRWNSTSYDSVQEDDVTTLRRSTRTKRSAIPSDYEVYLQEPDHNIRAKNDPGPWVVKSQNYGTMPGGRDEFHEG